MTSPFKKLLSTSLLFLPLVLAAPQANTHTARQTTWWKPAAGATWQIQLSNPPTTAEIAEYPIVSVYDIDLEETPVSTIQHIHSLGSKVICYFSAGSYESGRSDSNQFLAADKGKKMEGWPEYWVDTRSANIRRIMTARIQSAKDKGCDGVDPDNVDGYGNDSGFPLTAADAVDYMEFLANEAHSRGLAIGLKNALDIVEDTLEFMDWQVNEQCEEYFIDDEETTTECVRLKPYIDAGKPVFHIEYPEGAPDVDPELREQICGNKDIEGFSTLLKEYDLNTWVDVC